MKIGIIGAENTHSEAIARAINSDRLVPDCSVDFIWGETKELAEITARNGSIPNIVENPSEMLGRVDAVIIDHRHPIHHLPAALPFIEARIPMFIDKPFCYRTEEGSRFLARARLLNTPVTSFSVLPRQESFKAFIGKLREAGRIKSGTLQGACDIDSPYGGIFFYGIHQVELALKTFGYDVCAVQAVRKNKDAQATMFYKDNLVVTLNLIHHGCPGFSIAADCENGIIRQDIVFDSNIYLSGIRTFTEMFKTRKQPESFENMLKPVQVLEAMEKSIMDNGPIIQVEPLTTGD